jgi:hypothetical protein
VHAGQGLPGCSVAMERGLTRARVCCFEQPLVSGAVVDEADAGEANSVGRSSLERANRA